VLRVGGFLPPHLEVASYERWTNMEACIMGKIFRDSHDDQQEGLMRTIHIGNSWERRYLIAKGIFWGTIASVATGCTVALTDYAIFKFSDYSGILGWLLG